MKIVALAHYSRTGKDSFANALIRSLGEYNRSVRAAKRPFAYKLKEIAHELYGWDGVQPPLFYEEKENEYLRDVALPTVGKTPVQIWVDLGNALREHVYPETWVDYVLRGTNDLDLVVIPDCRFPNEVEAIRKLGGTIIKIVRPGYGPRKTKSDRALLGYDGWDFIFGASGKMSELEQRASQLAQAITSSGYVSMTRQTDQQRQDAMNVEVIEPWDKEVAA